jgi:hypothetical protein
MSKESGEEFEVINDDELSLCLVNQCEGCADCQHPQTLKATARIRTIQLAIEDLEKSLADKKKELDHFLTLRRLLCKHFWTVLSDRETCKRCGSERVKAHRKNERSGQDAAGGDEKLR